MRSHIDTVGVSNDAANMSKEKFLVWLLFNVIFLMFGRSHCFLGINQYFGELKVSCSMALHGGHGVRTIDLWHRSPTLYHFSHRARLLRSKTNVLVSNLVRHKPGCTATEDDQRFEISDLDSRGIVLSM